jgi:hypothetical protein
MKCDLKLPWGAALAILLTASIALAATHRLPRGLADVTIDNNWTVTFGERLRAVSADQFVTLTLRDVTPDTAQSPPAPPIKDFKRVGDPERLSFNGFTGYLQRGKGRVEGAVVSADEIVLTHHNRGFAIRGWAFGAPAKYTRERRRQVRRIVRSLRSVP